MNGESLYLRCKPGDVAPLVLLTGDPSRVARLAELMDDADEIANNREYVVATGSYRNTPVSVVSAGIGAPSTAIAIHELAQLGVHAIVRVGTMMGIHAPLESVVIPTGSARFEGTLVALSAARLPCCAGLAAGPVTGSGRPRGWGGSATRPDSNV